MKQPEPFDITGTVMMARIDEPAMIVHLPDGRDVAAPFSAEHEQAVLAALKDHNGVRLRVRGRAYFSSDGEIDRVVEVSDVELLPQGVKPVDPNAKPVWKAIEEIISDATQDEIERLPTDGAAQHDHYIYGLPKRTG